MYIFYRLECKFCKKRIRCAYLGFLKFAVTNNATVNSLP